jgi:hypothetical protein
LPAPLDSPDDEEEKGCSDLDSDANGMATARHDNAKRLLFRTVRNYSVYVFRHLSGLTCSSGAAGLGG